MDLLINLLAGTYLQALEAGAHALAVYALPILSIAALVQFHREWWPVVLSGGSHLGEALGHFIFLLVTVGFYLWLILNLWEIGQAAFDTFATWGMLGGGNGLSSEQLRNPGFLMDMGLKVAFPMAEQASWFQKAWQAVNMAFAPSEWLMVVAIILAFLAIAVHHLFLLVEFYLALMCGHVLIGWGIWRCTAHFAEFSLGWITGSLIRALVSCTMIGISIPLFEQLRAPVVSGGIFDVMTYIQTATPVVGSIIFAVLAWMLPARAARMAGGATLGLTGSTIASAAMTTTRFVQMSAGAVRGTSQMLRRVGA
jgi:P-type conjugative transfer protein TrbL